MLIFMQLVVATSRSGGRGSLALPSAALVGLVSGHGGGRRRVFDADSPSACSIRVRCVDPVPMAKSRWPPAKHILAQTAKWPPRTSPHLSITVPPQCAGSRTRPPSRRTNRECPRGIASDEPHRSYQTLAAVPGSSPSHHALLGYPVPIHVSLPHVRSSK